MYKIMLLVALFLLSQILIIPIVWGEGPAKEPIETYVVTMEEIEAPQGLIMEKEEIELIKRVVAAESRGEPYEGIKAVAQCIRDRSLAWGMTPTEVVLAKAQFAKPFKGEVSKAVNDAVYEVFFGNVSVYNGSITHFHSTAVNPYWAKSHPKYGRIGNHIFYGSYY